MPAKKKSLPDLKTGTLSRSFSLAKVLVGSGARAAAHAVGNIFSSEAEKAESLKKLFLAQIRHLTDELGQLKGSLMKAGQMLSVLGEHFLPAEVNEVLKSLQSQAPPLEWPAMERQLRRQLGEEKMALLRIDTEPAASASMGQVHRAVRKSGGEALALKIQYPGVDRAIEGDLKALKSLLGMLKLIPKGPDVDELFQEVRQMLHQEVDYKKELAATEAFRTDLTGDPRYIVPRAHPEFSTGRVIAFDYEEGFAVDDPRILGLPQKRRDALAEALLDLYFRELFVLNRVQTDPHFGNYRVRPGKNGEPDRLILFDFGAVRALSKKFMTPYTELVRGVIDRDDETTLRAAGELGFKFSADAATFQKRFVELLYLIGEPFHAPDYDFGASDLPKRVARKAGEVALSLQFQTPPREVVFLDRKMGGVFVFLSTLKARLPAREILLKHL